MKVLHLITGLTVGGAEIALARTLPELEGNHVVVSFLPRAPIGEQLEQLGVRVIYLHLHSYFNFFALIRLYRVLRKERPDILTTYLLHADIVGRVIGRLCRVPVIVSSLRCAHQDKPLWVWCARMTAPLADAFIAVSEPVQQWASEKLSIPRNRITVIPNGYAPAQTFAYHDIQKLRANLRIPQETTILLSVSRLDPQKGMQYLLDALYILQKKQTLPSFILLIAGDGRERNFLENHVRTMQLGQYVRFLGWRDDVPLLLASCDIFVLPTLFEGLSNAVMEAMNAARVVVTTDIPENKALITNNRNGILVPAANGTTLAKALATLLTSETQRRLLGQAAQETIRTQFALESVVVLLQKFYHNLYVRNRGKTQF